jgi:hypothetical protein
MSWTITVNSVSKTAAEWGFHRLRRRLASQAPDLLTFEHVVQTMDTTPLFAFGDTLRLYHPNGTKWFQGTVIQTPLSAQPGSEAHGYVVAGPWWNLDESVFKQPWAIAGGTTKYTGHIMLNLFAGPALASISAQVTSICNYLLGLYPAGSKPFQLGTIAPAAFPPITEINGISCGAAIRLELRWAPDAVTWFDYTTDPPTLNIKHRAGLTAVNLSILDQVSVSIIPRSDIVRPAVHIQYERTAIENGKRLLSILDDVSPVSATGNEPRALVVPISVLGPNRNVSRVTIETDDISPTSVAWWQKYYKPFSDSRYANIAISGVARQTPDGAASQSYPRMLTAGQIAEWTGFEWENEVIKAVVSYDFYNTVSTEPAAVKLATAQNEVVSVSLVATNATAGDFWSAEIVDVGDPIPVGLAAYLYDALSVLHYDGEIVIPGQEIDSTGPTLGNSINITDGRAEWTTMAALVQSIEEDIDGGMKRVVVGPPGHLGAQDIMELLRVAKRFREFIAESQDTGEIGDGGEVALPEATANTNSAGGDREPQLFSVRDGNVRIILDAINKRVLIYDSTTLKVDISLSDLSAVPAASLPVKLRETIICELVGSTQVQKKSVVLRSNTYAL